MSSNKKYGEETEMVSFRVPVSKKTEIKQIVKLKLNEYEKMALTKESEVINDVIPKWKQEVEKKLNPTDEVIENPPIIEKEHYPVNASNYREEKLVYDAPKVTDLISDEAGQFVKPKTKNVDMDALRKIASGEGLKGEFALTKKKVNIDEKYEFEYVKSIPDQDDQIPVDKKGLAFYSKYDLGVFYVKWEGKYMRFDSKAEFDRFGKEYLTLI